MAFLGNILKKNAFFLPKNLQNHFFALYLHHETRMVDSSKG